MQTMGDARVGELVAAAATAACSHSAVMAEASAICERRCACNRCCSNCIRQLLQLRVTGQRSLQVACLQMACTPGLSDFHLDSLVLDECCSKTMMQTMFKTAGS